MLYDLYLTLLTFVTLHFYEVVTDFTRHQLKEHTYADHVGQNLSADFPQVTVVTFHSSYGSQLWVQSKL